MAFHPGRLPHVLNLRPNCRFRVQQQPEGVANEIALHLYYIALEAVSNAAKHGKAKNIMITLEPARDRYALRVDDDGTGFSADCADAGAPTEKVGVSAVETGAGSGNARTGGKARIETATMLAITRIGLVLMGAISRESCDRFRN